MKTFNLLENLNCISLDILLYMLSLYYVSVLWSRHSLYYEKETQLDSPLSLTSFENENIIIISDICIFENEKKNSKMMMNMMSLY